MSKSARWFDDLPNEIIFIMFDYLSSNDILYAFFFFSQRFKNFLLENQRYLNNLVLPTTELRIWKKIFSIIGSRIELLIINSIDLSLQYFSNLKSLIIYNIPDEEIKLIFQINQFNYLHLFKLKYHRYYNDYSINKDNILKKVFNKNNSLEIFEYSLLIPSFTQINIEINSKLHSLTIILNDFEDIFQLISYIPNIKYLNVHSEPPFTDGKILKNVQNNLKEFYLKLGIREDNPIDFDKLINGIKEFSSSLICLSVDLVNTHITSSDEFPFNSLKLQQLLEFLIQLKQFHLYAKLDNNSVYNLDILHKFQNEFWFDHNWSFGTHEKYFYTLPFHFDYLHEFYHHDESNNLRLWYNVKSLYYPYVSSYDLNRPEKFQMKMPKLSFIKFDYFHHKNRMKEQENICVTFRNVKTIEFTTGCMEDGRDLLIYGFKNLNHLILSRINLPSIKSQLTEVLDTKIHRLDINITSELEKLTDLSYHYFSNVKEIYFDLNNGTEGPKWYANIVIKILKNFQNLKSLIIDMNQMYEIDGYSKIKLSEFIQYLHMKIIKQNYQVKIFTNAVIFKREIS